MVSAVQVPFVVLNVMSCSLPFHSMKIAVSNLDQLGALESGTLPSSAELPAHLHLIYRQNSELYQVISQQIKVVGMEHVLILIRVEVRSAPVQFPKKFARLICIRVESPARMKVMALSVRKFHGTVNQPIY